VPKAAEAELRVRAVGLNFRDVLNVMGASDFVGFWAWG
jgi:NADPH:quinone reductase-like Zn-dependent oxidoreductase